MSVHELEPSAAGSMHPAHGRGVPNHEGRRRYSVVHFLIALVLLIVTEPFVKQLQVGDLIEAVLTTLVLLSAVMAVGGRRRTLIAAAVLVMPAVAGTWIDHFRDNVVPHSLTSVATMVFIAFVIVHLLRFIVLAPRVNSEVLCAGIAAYLMLGLFWAVVYTLVAQLDPRAFVFTVGSDPHRVMAGFEALYFSLETLTTVDYGDIIPVSNTARLLAMIEATTTMFYVTVLIARLVSLYSSNRPSPPSSTVNG